MHSPALRHLPASVALHVVLVAAWLGWTRARPPTSVPRPTPPADVLDLDFVRAPRSMPTPPAPAAPAPLARGSRPRANASPARSSSRRASSAAPDVPASGVAAPAPAGLANTAATPAPAAQPSAAGILTRLDGDIARASAAGAIATASSIARPGDRDLVPRETGTAFDRARAASQGYVARLLEGTQHTLPPGVSSYYWGLRRRMIESWRTTAVPEPTAAGATLSVLANGLGITRRSQGGLAYGRAGAAVDTQNSLGASANASTGTGALLPTIAALAEAGQQTTRAEIEVEQDPTGRVLRVRVLRRSRVAGFDDSAVRAVREALAVQPQVAMPGGRRSRWSLERVVSRDPLLPVAGIEFDESTGWVEIHAPGRLHSRVRVQLESSQPL